MFGLIWALLSTAWAAQIVVQLKEGVPLDQFSIQYARGIGSQYSEMAETFTIGSFRAFSGEISPEILRKLFNDPQVAAISRDKLLQLQEIVLQSQAPQHLVGLSSVSPQSHQPFIYRADAGNGVDVYVLDSGIDINHPNLQNVNILQLADLTNQPMPQGTDPHGHGTAMAGLIAAETFGVIKKCNLVDVRVADSNGTVKMTALLAALSITQQHIEKTKRPSVVVIPIGSPESGVNPIIRDAISNFNADVSIIIAAGNQASDACQYSPASIRPKSPNVLVAGAVDSHNEPAPFTNFGSCVDIYTAGLDVTTIQSTDASSDTLTRRVSGTSVSGAITAGVVGYYMSLGLSSMQAIEKVLTYSKCTNTFANQVPSSNECARLLQLMP